MSDGDKKILKAVIAGNLQDVQKILKNLPAEDIDRQFGDKGLSLMCYAAQYGHIKVVDALLAAGADPDARGKNTGSPLCAALYGGQQAIANMLIGKLKDKYKDQPHEYHEALTINGRVLKRAKEGKLQKFIKPFIDKAAADAGDFSGFYQAVKSGKTELVKRYIKAGLSVEDIDKKRGEYERSALYAAAREGYNDILELLVKAGGNPDSRNYDNYSPLTVALDNSNLKSAEIVLNALKAFYKNDPQQHLAALTFKDGKTPLGYAKSAGLGQRLEDEIFDAEMACGNFSGVYDAAKNGDIARIKKYIAAGLPVEEINKKHEKKWSAMRIAARSGHTEIFETLFQAGGDPDTRGNGNWPPLMSAIEREHYDTARAVISALKEYYKNDPEKLHEALTHKSDGGDTSLNYASGKIKEDLQKEISDIQIACGDFSGFYKAVGNGDTALVKRYLDAGLPVEEIDKQHGKFKRSALYAAARDGHHYILELLVKAGGNPDRRNTGSWSPLTVALNKNNLKCAKLVLAALKDYYAQEPEQHLAALTFTQSSKTSKTPLDYASETALGPLIENEIFDASVTTGDFSGFYSAIESGNEELVQRYLDKGVSPDLRLENKSALSVALKSEQRHIVQTLLPLLEDHYKDDPDGLYEALTLNDEIAMSAESGEITDLIAPLLYETGVKTGNLFGIYEAVVSDNLSLVQKYIDAGATAIEIDTVRDCENDEETLRGNSLHYACGLYTPAILDLLISHGGDIITPDEAESTPLTLAAGHNSLQHVEILLAAIKDKLKDEPEKWLEHLNHKNNDEKTARASTTNKTVERLINENIFEASLACGNFDGLYNAACNGNTELVQRYIDAGATTAHIDKKFGDNKASSVYIATQQNHPAALEILLKSSGNPHDRQAYGWHPITVALSEGYRECLSLLIPALREYYKCDPQKYLTLLTTKDPYDVLPLRRAKSLGITDQIKNEIDAAKKTVKLYNKDPEGYKRSVAPPPAPAALIAAKPEEFIAPALSFDKDAVITEVRNIDKGSLSDAMLVGNDLQMIFNQASSLIAQRAVSCLGTRSELQELIQQISDDMDGQSISVPRAANNNTGPLLKLWHKMFGSDKTNMTDSEKFAALETILASMPEVISHEIDKNAHKLGDFEKIRSFLKTMDQAFDLYLAELDKKQKELAQENANPDMLRIVKTRHDSLLVSAAILANLHNTMDFMVTSCITNGGSLQALQGEAVPLLNNHFTTVSSLHQLAIAQSMDQSTARLEGGLQQSLSMHLIDPDSDTPIELQIENRFKETKGEVLKLLSVPQERLEEIEEEQTKAMKKIADPTVSTDFRDNNNPGPL